MPVTLIEDGVAVQVWEDVHTVQELRAKYGLWGAQYVNGGHPSGTIYDGVKFTAPPKKSRPPEPVSPIVAALQLLAVGHPNETAILETLNEVTS